MAASALSAVLLAVAAALGWGAADFFGGEASRRRTSVFAVVALTELIGLALMRVPLLAAGDPPPANPRLALAALAGVAVTGELGLIYRALARGRAFITAPTGALGSAVAVAVGLASGNRLDLGVALGLVTALSGAGLSAWTSPAADERGAGGWSGVAICLGAATAVAAMLTCLHAAGEVNPLWATAVEHASTALSAGCAAAVGARGNRAASPTPSPRLRLVLPRCTQLPTVAVVAVAGVGGDLAYATASHQGALSIIAAVSSLYPLSTIALGRLLRGQRASAAQTAGIVLALLGAALLGATAG